MRAGLFKRTLYRNLKFMIIPLMFIVFMGILVSYEFTKLPEYQMFSITTLETIEKNYAEGKVNVSFEVKGLKPAGFDYLVDGKKKGSYYYLRTDDKMYLLVLGEKASVTFASEADASGNELNFAVIKDDATAAFVADNYEEKMGLGADSMKDYVSPYILSQPDFPAIRIYGIRLTFIVLTILLAAMIIYLLLSAQFPILNFQSWSLKKLGKVNAVIRDIDLQLADDMKYGKDDIYVTEDFLVAAYLSHVEVIRLDDVKYLTKNVQMHKRLFNKSFPIYVLTASNVDKMYFECEFYKEEDIDEVIRLIRNEETVEEKNESSDS